DLVENLPQLSEPIDLPADRHTLRPAGLDRAPRPPPDMHRMHPEVDGGQDIVVEPVTDLHDLVRLEIELVAEPLEEGRVGLRHAPRRGGADHLGAEIERLDLLGDTLALIPGDGDAIVLGPQL